MRSTRAGRAPKRFEDRGRGHEHCGVGLRLPPNDELNQRESAEKAVGIAGDVADDQTTFVRGNYHPNRFATLPPPRSDS